jgi:hypothetical protein
VSAEAADAETGPIECEWRNDCIDSRPIEKPGVDDRLRLVNSAPHLGNDFFNNVQKVSVVAEANGYLGELSATLDINLVEAVDQNVRDGRFFEEWLERSQPEDFVENLFDDAVLFSGGHRNVFVFEQSFNDPTNLGAQTFFGKGRDPFEV